MVSAEFSPLAKTGGLGDATAGLCNALSENGHDVRVLIPKYAHLPPAGTHSGTFSSRDQRFRYCELERKSDGPAIYLLETPQLADVSGVYTGDERDALRFLSLSVAAASLGPALHWAPDVVHCHDWHASLVPLALCRQPNGHAFLNGRVNTILTIHNIGYQGVFEASVLARYGFGEYADGVAPATSDGDINLLRTGITTADAITTVSPTYAREIQTAEFGMGLEDVIRARRSVLSGRLNGVDYSTWDPRNDPYIGERFTARKLAGKAKVRGSLRERLGLQDGERAPLIGVVSRLAYQKGIDVLVEALPALLEKTRAQFAILGSGDPELERALGEHAAANPTRVAFTGGYDEELAHRIIAGSDMFLVPSRYEPCGLTQLYALRYGTIPIVRATGGLADTIEPFDAATGLGNGCMFEHSTAEDLSRCVEMTIVLYENHAKWTALMANAMAADFSWRAQVADYETLYLRVASE